MNRVQESLLAARQGEGLAEGQLRPPPVGRLRLFDEAVWYVIRKRSESTVFQAYRG